MHWIRHLSSVGGALVTGWAPLFGTSAECLRTTEERTLTYVLVLSLPPGMFSLLFH